MCDKIISGGSNGYFEMGFWIEMSCWTSFKFRSWCEITSMFDGFCIFFMLETRKDIRENEMKMIVPRIGI